MTDYRPIDCKTYGEYELAIVRRQRLRVRWQDASGLPHVETLVPLDLETCEGEEFLHAQNANGERLRLRLDRIRGAAVVPHGSDPIRFPPR